MIQCNEIEYCKLKVHYVADKDKVISTRKKAVSEFRKNVKIPGFRPGRAPDYAVEVKLKKQIENWVKQELVAEAYKDILFETKAKPLAYPQVEYSDLHDSDFWCDLVLYKKPEFELKQYKGFDIPNPSLPHTNEELTEKILQDLRVRSGDFLPYEENDFVQQGDRVTMSFEGFQEGQKVDRFSQEGILYTVGQEVYPGFDDNILGMSAGEERSFTLSIKKDQADTEMCTFKVTVHMGMKHHPAALDDELAKKVGFQTFELLRQQVVGAATNRNQSLKAQLLNQQIIKRLLVEHDFQVPEWYAKMEAQQLSGKYSEQAWDGLTSDERDSWLSKAKDNVKLALILDSIRENEPETAFNERELTNMLEQNLVGSVQDPHQFISEASRDGRLIGMLANLKNDLTLKWIADSCKIID